VRRSGSIVDMVPMSHVRRSRAVFAVVAPLPVVAAADHGGWPWWVTLIPVLVVVAIVAELAGIYVGAFSALVGTAGVALVVGRSGSGEEPKNGVELGAMAALLLVAVLFGTDKPPVD
jgi:hypothetical protein